MFTLRNKDTKKLISFETRSNGGKDYCVDVSVFLVESYRISDPVWVVNSYDTVLSALNNPQSWFNADYLNPSHKLNPDEWEIVELKVVDME
jgi:hypothetical protein